MMVLKQLASDKEIKTSTDKLLGTLEYSYNGVSFYVHPTTHKLCIDHYDSASAEHWTEEHDTLHELKTHIDSSMLTIRCNACGKESKKYSEQYDNFLYHPGGGLMTCPYCHELHDDFSEV